MSRTVIDRLILIITPSAKYDLTATKFAVGRGSLQRFGFFCANYFVALLRLGLAKLRR
jgi:hypothetical protein